MNDVANAKFDLIISGGRVLDGTGSPERLVDVGVRDGVIAAVEQGLAAQAGATTELIDATGRLVTPGFVDLHTHFDGQVTWDELLDPVTGHGVTTVMMGNCGVGFAPVRPGREQQLIELMEGVEDIPGTALSEGIDWRWETFPEYLDVLESGQWSVDVGTHVPHGAVRAYVRPGDPGGEATEEELREMARIVQEGIEAGAYGFTTSRTMGHRSVDGSPVPGTFAVLDELLAMGAAVAAGGGKIFEVAPSGLFRSDDPTIVAGEVAWMGQVAERTGLTVTFIMLQSHDQPDRWRDEIAEARRWTAMGARVVPLVAARSASILYGWDIRHPFMARPSYRAIDGLPLAERITALRDPAIRAAILSEQDQIDRPAVANELRFLRNVLPLCFAMSGDADYEQPLDRRLTVLAEQRAQTIETVAYDELLVDGALLRYPLYNYAGGDHSVLHEQLSDPDSLVSLGDGGAHCAFICDASMPTYLLTHWGRDRVRGPRLAVPDLIRRLTSQPADLYGLADRGRIAPGLRADLNVIDFDRLSLAMPAAVHDLPAGGTRLLQPATGYDATIVRGVVTRRHGHDTGARPGRLLRRH
jgi:N-acyl-D-aspartate/D-glutamate deacylase